LSRCRSSGSSSKETTQVSLENIDLLFGERALGTLPDDLNKEAMGLHATAVQTEKVENADHGVAGRTMSF
jgi:hypothetical protein